MTTHPLVKGSPAQAYQIEQTDRGTGWIKNISEGGAAGRSSQCQGVICGLLTVCDCCLDLCLSKPLRDLAISLFPDFASRVAFLISPYVADRPHGRFAIDRECKSFVWEDDPNLFYESVELLGGVGGAIGPTIVISWCCW